MERMPRAVRVVFLFSCLGLFRPSFISVFSVESRGTSSKDFVTFETWTQRRCLVQRAGLVLETCSVVSAPGSRPHKTPWACSRRTPSLRRGALTPGHLGGVLTFNLLLLISKPLKILINSHKAPGGTFLISTVPFTPAG